MGRTIFFPRTLAAFLLLALPMLLLGGCRRSAGENEPNVVTVRYMAWGNPEQIAVERQIAREFEKSHPGVRIHLFMVPGSAYADKLQLMLASRTAPDVMRADRYYFPALAKKDYFLPLEPLIAREAPGFLDDFEPIAVQEGRYDGKLYGLNVLFGSVQIYYNKKLFADAGLPDPYDTYRQGKWDWATFVQTAEKLTRRDASGRATQFGTNMVGFPLYASVIWNFGGDIMNADQTRLVMADDPGAIAGMQAYADLRWKHHCAPTPADSALSAFTFESGKIAMQWGWAGESPRYRKNIKSFDWDIVPLPTGPDASTTVVKGNLLTINRETPHAQAAWEFVKFMTGPEAEMMLCGALRRAVPTRKSVQQDPRYLAADQPPYHTDVFLESVRRGRTVPIDARYQEWTQEFNSALSVLFDVHKADAREALQDACRRANKVLSEEEGF